MTIQPFSVLIVYPHPLVVCVGPLLPHAAVGPSPLGRAVVELHRDPVAQTVHVHRGSALAERTAKTREFKS